MTALLEIDLDAIAANWRALDAMHAGRTAGVVKADAYGLGAAQVAPKLLSNLSEVRARGARVFVVADSSCPQIAELAEHVVRIPDTDPLLQVLLATVPLQLLAYHVARARSLNVDQPRNLAKTVTVE